MVFPWSEPRAARTRISRRCNPRRRAFLGMKLKRGLAALGASVPTTTATSWPGRTTRAVQAGWLTAMMAQVLLLAALAAIVARRGFALDAAGWVAGITCGVIMNAALARGLSHYRFERLTPA